MRALFLSFRGAERPAERPESCVPKARQGGLKARGEGRNRTSSYSCR